MPHFLGVDVGGTNTRLMLMDSQRNFRGYHKTLTQSWAGQSDPLQGLKNLITAYLQEQDPHHQVSQVMLGMPGILSRDRQTVLSLPFISALDNQPVAALLSARLHLPVAMDKDVNHLMWWDLTQQSALPDIAVGLYLGTGMGNSLWINGDFYHGAHGGAGEIGHIPLAGNPLLCPCGKAGCVETVTSGNWLTGWARQHAPQTPFAELFVHHAGHVDLIEFVARLARTVASEMNILDPEYLVLGGGVLAMENFPLAELEQQLRSHLRSPFPAASLTIHFSAVTDETGCRGACLAAQRIFPPQPALAGGTFSFRREA